MNQFDSMVKFINLIIVGGTNEDKLTAKWMIILCIFVTIEKKTKQKDSMLYLWLNNQNAFCSVI